MHEAKDHEVTIIVDSRVVGQGLKALDLAMLQEVSSNGCKAGICLSSSLTASLSTQVTHGKHMTTFSVSD